MPVIVGLNGDDEHCALHVVDEKMVNVVTIEEDSETQQEVCKVSLRCGDKPSELLSGFHFEKYTKVMVIYVEGSAPFKGQFTWFKAPSLCGDVPISVWLSSQWLIEYTIGQDAQRRVHRLAEKLQYDLKELEFSPLHCMESLLSRQRKRQKRNAEDATDDLEGCQEWRVSMIGDFVFLFMDCWAI